jgi:cyclophilin family peptidyl-prolyl cis-trans isomerase
MPSADKRARKKENARAAREQREAALKRKKRLRSFLTIGVISAVFIGLIVILSIAGGKDKKKAASKTTTPVTSVSGPTCVKTVPKKETKKKYKAEPAMTIDTAKTYVAHISTTCGTFDVTLDAKVAPHTVNSFVFLANAHFYDGLTFHRLVKDFVIQGGDPDGDGSGGPGYEMATEPPKDGYKTGSVAMANAGEGTTGSQFFVAVSENGAKGLGETPPYKYSDLGNVTKGLDVIHKLMTYAPASDGPPTTPLYIFKVTISTSDQPAGTTTSSSVTTAPSASTSTTLPAR